MPGLDYKNGVPPRTGGASIGQVFGRRRFYNGAPGRELVDCPDCALPADALFGDHGGQCLIDLAPKKLGSAVEVIRRYARTHEVLSANELRPLMEQAGVKHYSQALASMVRRGELRAAGHTPSTDPGTKAHHVQTYESLILRRPK